MPFQYVWHSHSAHSPPHACSGDSSIYYTLSKFSSRKQLFLWEVQPEQKIDCLVETTLGKFLCLREQVRSVCGPPCSLSEARKSMCTHPHTNHTHLYENAPIPHVQAHTHTLTWTHLKTSIMCSNVQYLHTRTRVYTLLRSRAHTLQLSDQFLCSTSAVSPECQDCTAQCHLKSRHLYLLLFHSDEKLWWYHF